MRQGFAMKSAIAIGYRPIHTASATMTTTAAMKISA
jgi:hypothetical protein